LLILIGSSLILFSVCFYFINGSPNRNGSFITPEVSTKAKKSRTIAIRLGALGLLLIFFQTLTI
jgi:hypothetical protein